MTPAPQKWLDGKMMPREEVDRILAERQEARNRLFLLVVPAGDASFRHAVEALHAAGDPLAAQVRSWSAVTVAADDAAYVPLVLPEGAAGAADLVGPGPMSLDDGVRVVAGPDARSLAIDVGVRDTAVVTAENFRRFWGLVCGDAVPREAGTSGEPPVAEPGAAAELPDAEGRLRELQAAGVDRVRAMQQVLQEIKDGVPGADMAAEVARISDVAKRIWRAAGPGPESADDVMIDAMMKAGEDDEVLAGIADEKIRAGTALDYVIECYHTGHTGDGQIARCLAIATANMACNNSKGVYILVSGEVGAGKSHSVESWIEHLPSANRLDGGFSDKYVFYGGLTGPLMIYIDDRDLSDDLQETIKQATSHFQRETKHHTVTTDRKPTDLSLPPRVAFIFSKVENVGDDQIRDRVLMPWVDGSDTHYTAVTRSMLAAAAAGPDDVSGDSNRWRIGEAVLRRILGSEFFVQIPFATDVMVESIGYRNLALFLDIVRGFAIWTWPRREPVDCDGFVWIRASVDDFNAALKLFGALSNVQGSQIQKLTKREAAVIDVIRNEKLHEFTRRDIQRLLSWSYDRVRDTLDGGRGKNKGEGLLAKCPAITLVENRSVRKNEDVRESGVYYQVDLEGLNVWAWTVPISLRGGEGI